MKLEDAIKKIVEEALAGGKLVEGRTADPIVDDTANALAHALITAMEESHIMEYAFEVMMGSQPDEDRLTLARFEDIPSTAELIVQAVYRDPGFHDALHTAAEQMLRNAMHAMGK